MTNTVKAYSAAFAFSLTIGFSFMAIKICLNYASSIDILAHRFFVAGLVALGAFLLNKNRPKLKFKELLPVFGLSLFYPLLFFFFQTSSLVYIETVQAGIIQALGPAFVLILALFILRERITPLKCLFVLISVGGVIFIFVMGGAFDASYSPLGIALIFGATIAMSCNTVLARKLTKSYSVFTLATIMSLVGFIVFGIIALSINAAQDNLNHFFDPFSQLDYVIAIVFLGVASSYGSSFLSTYAVSKLQASKMSVFTNLSTIIALVVGAVFLNEDFFWYHAVGALVVIAGVLGMNLTKDKKLDTENKAKPVES